MSGDAPVSVTGALPLPPGGRAVPVPGDVRMADAVYVPPTRGALVHDGSSVYLVTDQGVRYPVGGPDAAKALGYGGVRAAAAPSALLALFPTGPALDTAAAQQAAAP